MSTSPDRKRFNMEAVRRFISWVFEPKNDVLEDVLSSTSEEELFTLLKLGDPNVARLAWAEYGRRRKFVDFKLAVVESRGNIRVTFDGTAKPIHPNPVVYDPD